MVSKILIFCGVISGWGVILLVYLYSQVVDTGGGTVFVPLLNGAGKPYAVMDFMDNTHNIN